MKTGFFDFLWEALQMIHPPAQADSKTSPGFRFTAHAENTLQWAGSYYGLTNDADFVITVLIQLIQKAIMKGIFGQGTFGRSAVLRRGRPFLLLRLS